MYCFNLSEVRPKVNILPWLGKSYSILFYCTLQDLFYYVILFPVLSLGLLNLVSKGAATAYGRSLELWSYCTRLSLD